MSDNENSPTAGQAPDHSDRRGFLSTASSVAMAGGLAAGYGTLAVMAGRFLYPSGDSSVGWCFVATLDQLKIGQAMAFETPSGAKVVIARQSAGDTVENFVALSSICPHLGCQVHWEPHNDRFFCPCHNGVFDPQGNALEGPPAQAKQQLTRFPLKVEDGLLFIEAPLRTVGQAVARNGDAATAAKSLGQEA